MRSKSKGAPKQSNHEPLGIADKHNHLRRCFSEGVVFTEELPKLARSPVRSEVARTSIIGEYFPWTRAHEVFSGNAGEGFNQRVRGFGRGCARYHQA
jgi:hypothetical protein